MFDGADPLWSERRRFSRAEAWIDLLQLAAFRAGPFVTERGTEHLARGEVVASLRYVADRWGWDKNAATRFLEWCEREGQISGHRQGQCGTVYRIANYDTYQGASGEVGTRNGTRLGTAGQQSGHESGQSHASARTEVTTTSGIDRRVNGTAIGTQNGTGEGQWRDKIQEGKAVKQLVRGTSTPSARRADTYPPEFEAVWDAYPRRAGSNPKRAAYGAWAARIRDGVVADDILAGTGRYARYIAAKGDGGTAFVMQAKRFFGPNREWEDSWDYQGICGERPTRDADGVLLAGASLASAMRADERRLAATHRNGSVPA